MQLDKNDVIRIRAAALKSFKDSGLRERALAGSKHHDDFIYCEKEFIQLFSDAMDGLQASEGKQDKKLSGKCWTCSKPIEPETEGFCDDCWEKGKQEGGGEDLWAGYSPNQAYRNGE